VDGKGLFGTVTGMNLADMSSMSNPFGHMARVPIRDVATREIDNSAGSYQHTSNDLCEEPQRKRTWCNGHSG
jgi:hypothetical protein